MPERKLRDNLTEEVNMISALNSIKENSDLRVALKVTLNLLETVTEKYKVARIKLKLATFDIKGENDRDVEET